jgi:hypothetical protein
MTETLWNAARHHWELAAARCDVKRSAIEVAGQRINLEFAGDPLSAVLLPPLAHVLVDPGPNPDLTISAWDSASTGIAFPVASRDDRLRIPAWRFGDSTAEVPLSGMRVIDQQAEGALGILTDSQAVFWTEDVSRLPAWERAQPMLHLLHWWYATRGLQIVHAGAFGRNGKGVIVVGPSGTGKSTTVLSAVANGMDYLGDDRILIDPGPPPRALHLYASAKLLREAHGPIARMLPPIANPDRTADEKALYVLNSGIVPSLEVIAVVAPRLTGERDATLDPIAPVEALSAMAPSSIVGTPGAGARAFTLMRILCGSVPCFRLRLGSPESVPDAFEKLLAC